MTTDPGAPADHAAENVDDPAAAAAAEVSARAAVTAAVAAVRAAIADACQAAGRQPNSVRLVAVTKTQTPAILTGLIAAGISAIGESRVDHGERMRTGLAQFPGVALDFIGRVQSRQLHDVVRVTDTLHSLHEPGHVERLGRAVVTIGGKAPFPVFIQVNISGEVSKAGIAVDQLGAMIERVRAVPALNAVGLMTMAPELSPTVSAQQICDVFACCRELAQQHGLARLSMGMSGDFPIAIAEGATDIRVGSRLFPPPATQRP